MVWKVNDSFFEIVSIINTCYEIQKRLHTFKEYYILGKKIQDMAHVPNQHTRTVLSLYE